jgi:predicted AlkP superfamily pyrophosphatase or phosphodiesterase
MSYAFPMAVQNKVILIGIDGLMLHRAIASGRAKTLARLKADSFFTDMSVAMPTVSGPSWSTILTGTTAEIHKVVDNDFKDHNLAQTLDLLSRAKALTPEITTYAAAGWPPLIDPADTGPVIATRLADQENGSHQIFVRDGETHGYEKIDFEVAIHALETIKNSGPDVSYLFFCGADEAGHIHGTLEGAYFDAIERIDSIVGNVYEVIAERNRTLDEKWLIVITTDHGHLDEGGHGGDSPQERASFVIAHGVGAPHPMWPKEIKPEHLVEHILSTL